MKLSPNMNCVLSVVSRMDRPIGKPMKLVRLELTTILFAGFCSTTEQAVHTGQLAHDRAGNGFTKYLFALVFIIR